MATIIRVAGADFSANPVGFMPPVAQGLEAWHYLGGDLTSSARNLAPGKANAMVGGTPGVETSHLRLGAGAYLQTAAMDTGDCTLLSVAKMPVGFPAFSTEYAYMLSAYGTGAPAPYFGFQGASGGVAPPAARAFNAAAYDNGGSPSTVQALLGGISDATVWRLYAASHKGGVGATIYNKTSASTGTAASALARLAYPAQQYLIGAVSGTSGVAIDIAFAAVYSRALSAEEIDAVYQAVKGYMTRRHAITV